MPPTPLTTFRHPALSLWQSAIHRILAEKGAATGEPGLHATSSHPLAEAAASVGDAFSTTAQAGIAGSLLLAGASLYAQLAVAKFEGNRDAVRILEDKIHDSALDPRWAEIMIQYEKSLLAGRADSYLRHRSMDDFVIPAPGNDLTIALLADWATGTASARALLEQVAAHRPDVVIHLGDVYFSGQPEEVEEHFFAVFRAVFGETMPPTYSLAGNHDRYSGGQGYLDLLKGLGQPSSYFCLRNDFWQLLALDTGYHDINPLTRHTSVTSLEETELAYHLDKFQRAGEGIAPGSDNAAGKRRTIVLSHHPLFSFKGVGKGPEGHQLACNPLLHTGLSPVLGDIEAWFWGHEHNLTLFGPYAGLARGRGIGSGAIPILVAQRPYEPVPDLILPEGESGPPALLPGTELGDDGAVYQHAFAILRLEGPKATVRYYALDMAGAPAGEPLYTEVLGG